MNNLIVMTENTGSFWLFAQSKNESTFCASYE